MPTHVDKCKRVQDINFLYGNDLARNRYLQHCPNTNIAKRLLKNENFKDKFEKFMEEENERQRMLKELEEPELDERGNVDEDDMEDALAAIELGKEKEKEMDGGKSKKVNKRKKRTVKRNSRRKRSTRRRM